MAMNGSALDDKRARSESPASCVISKERFSLLMNSAFPFLLSKALILILCVATGMVNISPQHITENGAR